MKCFCGFRDFLKNAVSKKAKAIINLKLGNVIYVEGHNCLRSLIF